MLIWRPGMPFSGRLCVKHVWDSWFDPWPILLPQTGLTFLLVCTFGAWWGCLPRVFRRPGTSSLVSQPLDQQFTTRLQGCGASWDLWTCSVRVMQVIPVMLGARAVSGSIGRGTAKMHIKCLGSGSHVVPGINLEWLHVSSVNYCTLWPLVLYFLKCSIFDPVKRC